MARAQRDHAVRVHIYPILTKDQLRAGIAAIAAACITLLTAKADIKLIELDGDWQGSGIDRNSPFESLQQITCRSKIRTAADRMTSDTVCKGRTGLNKTSRMTITLDGNNITGVLEASIKGSDDDSPRQLKGAIAGRRTGDTATLQIHLPGFMPNATAILNLISSSSYSIKVTTWGILMSDVTYNRVGQR
jgi:hypothetical protein